MACREVEIPCSHSHTWSQSSSHTGCHTRAGDGQGTPRCGGAWVNISWTQNTGPQSLQGESGAAACPPVSFS